jgi:hypothetical protein
MHTTVHVDLPVLVVCTFTCDASSSAARKGGDVIVSLYRTTRGYGYRYCEGTVATMSLKNDAQHRTDLLLCTSYRVSRCAVELLDYTGKTK